MNTGEESILKEIQTLLGEFKVMKDGSWMWKQLKQ